jgi:large subunit ribosomal protein L31
LVRFLKQLTLLPYLAGGDLMTNHPETHLIDAVCASCGTPYHVRSTAGSLSIDVCANCHPAYTGAKAVAAAAGSRIERFNRRAALAADAAV